MICKEDLEYFYYRLFRVISSINIYSKSLKVTVMVPVPFSGSQSLHPIVTSFFESLHTKGKKDHFILVYYIPCGISYKESLYTGHFIPSIQYQYTSYLSHFIPGTSSWSFHINHFKPIVGKIISLGAF